LPLRNSTNLGNDVCVQIRRLQPLLRPSLGVHDHERRPAIGTQIRQLRIGQSADVVDDRRSGV
jgi:hypothetical protein